MIILNRQEIKSLFQASPVGNVFKFSNVNLIKTTMLSLTSDCLNQLVTHKDGSRAEECFNGIVTLASAGHLTSL